MREHEIRRALLERLAAAHAQDGSVIVQELGLDSGRIRVDVAVINGLLAGYEIKSDNDTLLRLPAQRDVYNQVFDRVMLVAGPRHVGRATEAVPEFWGILVADPSVDGSLRLDRPAMVNQHRNPRTLAQLLWRTEAANILERLGTDGLQRAPRRVLWDELVRRLTVDELAAEVRTALKARTRWSTVLRPLSGGVPSRRAAMSSRCLTLTSTRSRTAG